MSERRLTVRCLDCSKDEDHPWLPLTYSATCGECAAKSVIDHLVEYPGHRCEVLSGSTDESKTTARLLGRNSR